MDDHSSQYSIFPVVRHAQGGPSPDGKALLVEASTTDGEVLRFAIGLTQVQQFVALLLVSVGRISQVPGIEALTSDTTITGSSPIPVTSIVIGEQVGAEGYLGIGVGQAELIFSVPMSVFDSLGRTMLTLSAPPNAQ